MFTFDITFRATLFYACYWISPLRVITEVLYQTIYKEKPSQSVRYKSEMRMIQRF